MPFPSFSKILLSSWHKTPTAHFPYVTNMVRGSLVPKAAIYLIQGCAHSQDTVLDLALGPSSQLTGSNKPKQGLKKPAHSLVPLQY